MARYNHPDRLIMLNISIKVIYVSKERRNSMMLKSNASVLSVGIITVSSHYFYIIYMQYIIILFNIGLWKERRERERGWWLLAYNMQTFIILHVDDKLSPPLHPPKYHFFSGIIVIPEINFGNEHTVSYCLK